MSQSTASDGPGVGIDPNLVRSLQRLASVCGLLVAGLGAVVLVGWLFDVETLKAVRPGLSTMKANTALAFSCLGVSLVNPRQRNVAVRRICALLVLAIGGATCVEYLLGVNLGIDQLLFRERPPASGRMAPATAFNFAVLGWATLRVDRKRADTVGAAGVAIVAIVSLLSFCGYLFGAGSLYRIGPLVSIAFHTTVGFLITCLGYAFARPECGIGAMLASDTPAGAILRRFLPVVIVFPLLLGWLRLRGEELGLYDTRVGVAILSTTSIVLFTMTLVLVSRSLRTSELQRRRVELAIRMHERELAITLDSIGDAVIATDSQGRVTRMNPVAQRLTGWSSSAAVGRPCAEVFRLHAEEGEATLESPVDQVLRTQDAINHSGGIVLEARDGSSLSIADSGSPIRAPGSDAIEGVVLVFRDTTRERASYRDHLFLLELGELLRAKKNWAEVVQAVSEGFAAFLRLTRCVFVEIDAAAEQLIIHPGFHGDRPPLAGTVPSTTLIPETAAEYRAGRTVAIDDTSLHAMTREHYQRVYEPAGARAMIAVPLHRDGKWAALLAASCDTPRVWEEREIALAQLVAERTWLWVEQLRMLEALRASEARKAAELKSAFDGIVSVDHHGAITAFNPAAERLFGYRREDVLGKPMVELIVPPVLRDAHSRGFARHLATGESSVIGKTMEVPAMRVDGSEFAAEVAITRVLGLEPPLFTAFIRDVSERKRLEAERLQLVDALREANSSLEARVSARTVELSATLKEREVLLQEIHHRVKNNLQVIISLINLQLRQVTDESGRAALLDCQRRIAAIALIHEKLYQAQDYSRVPFADYVKLLATTIFDAAGQAAANVTLAIDAATVWLTVDRAIPCGLIVNELVTNALKHAFPGGRQGQLRILLRPTDGNMIELVVSDDGIGIPTSFDLKGSGSLGMQLVTLLVKQIQGQLEIDSRAGTAFRIRFSNPADAEKS